MENGSYTEYFYDRPTELEHRLFKSEVGDNTGQQTWEALILLIALRLWSPRWKNKRVRLAVRSDSVTALTAILKMNSPSTNTSIIAREIALDVCDSVYRPTVVQHLPGVSNTIADALSRVFAPDAAGGVPETLRACTLRQAPARPVGWWRALSPP